jgi:hypothetical protein
VKARKLLDASEYIKSSIDHDLGASRHQMGDEYQQRSKDNNMKNVMMPSSSQDLDQQLIFQIINEYGQFHYRHKKIANQINIGKSGNVILIITVIA